MNIGRKTIKLNRARMYFSLISSLMILDIFSRGARWYAWALLVVGVVALYLFMQRVDTRVHEEEREYDLTRSASFRRLCEQVDALSRRRN